MRTVGIDRLIARQQCSRYPAGDGLIHPNQRGKTMSATITITIPTELEQRIAGRAAAQGKGIEQVAAEVLIKTFDQLEDYEATEISLQQVREGKTRPIREFLADDSLLDVEYMEACGKEADPSITLESVRQILAKVPGSLADDVNAERKKRF